MKKLIYIKMKPNEKKLVFKESLVFFFGFDSEFS